MNLRTLLLHRRQLARLVGAGLLLLLSVSVARAQTYGTDTTIWPNAQSKANSDDWIRLHHQQIKQMQPRLLVLNFVNGLRMEAATRTAQDLMAALRESSRYHGYAKPNAPAFLDYKLFKTIDLTDAQPLPETEQLDGNSSRYPRTPNWKDGDINFQYGQLFGDTFARYYGVPDPATPGRFLTLSELVNRGLVHEVWFLAKQGKYGAPFESVEVKQAYDENLRKAPGKSRAGRQRRQRSAALYRAQPAYSVHQRGSGHRLRDGVARTLA